MTGAAKAIDTAKMSDHLRARGIDVPGRKILISRLGGSEQEGDLHIPPNCGGYGRVRHFKLATSDGWPSNPLPIVPACKALGLAVPPMMTAQVFQNAACAWRCWYCFVPYNLLSADPRRSDWLTPEALVQLYSAEKDQPCIIDLSGGSPDLVPEWTVWMMEALEAAGLAPTTFLWTDDNLSTEYLFDELSKEQLARLTGYRNYGRVCCFKGFDAASFEFNTQANAVGFDRQFKIMRRLLDLGLDTYGYITLTGPSAHDLSGKISYLFDRLQTLDVNLPLRIVPLEIRSFAPMAQRMKSEHQDSIAVQAQAIVEWNTQIEQRFTAELRALDIASVPLKRRAVTLHE
jgi:uncharacterized Fe-S cluster-containing radical SAM superfamily protein